MNDDNFSPEEKTLQLIQSIAEMVEISEFLEDEKVNETLALIIKLMQKPEIPTSVAAPLVVKLTALSVAFNLKSKTYQFRAKGDRDATNKKNLYYSLSDGTEKLAAALKYIVRN